MTMQEEPILISSDQAAAMVGIKLRTWYTWDLLGNIPKPIHIGRKLFWRRDELHAWIAAGCPKREDWIYRPK